MEAKYFKQLQKAKSDEIAPGINGNLVRLAHLAAGGITSQDEREQIAATLEAKASEIGLGSEAVAATANELRGRSEVREYLRSIGRKGGQTITEATRAASRANGQRGGRRAKKAE